MKEIKAAEIYKVAKKELNLGIRQNRIYLKEGGEWIGLMDSELPVKIRALFPAEMQENISARAVTETVERLLQTPDLQLQFVEETEEKYVNLQNGVFNTETGRMEDLQNRNFGYRLGVRYLQKRERKANNFERFCNTTFPVETEKKRKLLLQILGYAVSDYCKAKTGFFLIGESNSGKSVILELLQGIFQERMVTAVPLYRLANRFNLARLADSKINISTELSEKSFGALDIFKMLTSNETVTAEHKGKKPFEFRVRCKTVNAGNLLPDMGTSEGMHAITNRMTILLFPVSIEKEKQDLALLEKLVSERDSIFSEALDELVTLAKGRFQFEEPEDTKRLKLQMQSVGNAFDDFIEDKCIYDESGREYISRLFEEFQRYNDENLLETKLTRNQFTQSLCKLPNAKRKKLRIDGGSPMWAMEGIRLKNYFEYDKRQDSGLSDVQKEEIEETGSVSTWNTGTLEQEVGDETTR